MALLDGRWGRRPHDNPMSGVSERNAGFRFQVILCQSDAYMYECRVQLSVAKYNTVPYEQIHTARRTHVGQGVMARQSTQTLGKTAEACRAVWCLRLPSGTFPYEVELDAYMPYAKSSKPPNGPWPVVVYFHGGGWTYRNRKYIPVTVVEFLRERRCICKRGVSSAAVRVERIAHSVGYGRRDGLLAQLRAKELCVDANRTLLMGNPAGGHLALMTGFTSLPDPVVRGIVDFCAVKPSDTDFAIDYPETSSYFKFTENKEWMKRYFTYYAYRQNDSASLMVHGMDDVLVPISRSYHLARF